MGLSSTKKFIYFIIPKTGSSTIRNVIDPYRDVKRPTEHFSEHVCIDRFISSPYADRFDEYFKFAFVRNPYDRLYSGFMQDYFAAYNLPHWEDAKRPIFDAIGEDFNAYVQQYVSKADIERDPFWICWCPMHKFTHMNGACAVDWIGRNETLHDDLKYLCSHLQIPDQSFENFNVRSESFEMGRHLRKYDARTIEIVNDLFDADFKYFQYQKVIV